MADNLKIGDTVKRMLGGQVPMTLPIMALTDDTITLGPFGWVFDRQTGLEIDGEIFVLVSHLVKEDGSPWQKNL